MEPEKPRFKKGDEVDYLWTDEYDRLYRDRAEIIEVVQTPEIREMVERVTPAKLEYVIRFQDGGKVRNHTRQEDLSKPHLSIYELMARHRK